jgi:heterodisulfide reductase subunit A
MKKKHRSAEKNATATTGVFLCECGGKISGAIDLSRVERRLKDSSEVDHVRIVPYGCMAPGLAQIRDEAEKHRLERLVLAGCERRIMLPKFETELHPAGLEGCIDLVNLKGHVAAVNSAEASALAEKGVKLILASVAWLKALVPASARKIEINHPVLILGGGIGGLAAAAELSRARMEAVIAEEAHPDVDDQLRAVRLRYPGDTHQHIRLERIVKEVHESPFVETVQVGQLEQVLGCVGDYTVLFSGNGTPPKSVKAGLLITALDAEMREQSSEFGYDGKRVLCQHEMEDLMHAHGVPTGNVVFWINDLETGQPHRECSVRNACNMGIAILENSPNATVTILCNNRIDLSRSADERLRARRMNILWENYDGLVRPTVQDGYVTYREETSCIERELEWDYLVLPPKRQVGADQARMAGILGLHVSHEDGFFDSNTQRVRPRQAGVGERFLVGSTGGACDLRESLRQGRRAGRKASELIRTAKAEELYSPRVVCVVDDTRCVGCGLCNDLCDCAAIAPVEAPGGNIPRVVDPMTCTGGGTCAAACPHQAITVQNNTTAQREAMVSALAGRLTEKEVMGFGCRWGGAAAADNAGVRGIPSDDRFYLLQVDCIGQLELEVMGRAFLEGAQALLLLGCPPGECHHSYGVDHACARVQLVRKLLSLAGLERERIALAHVDINRPEQFAGTVNRFMAMIDALGPISRNAATKARIRGIYDTLKNPRVRWVLGASLRRPWEPTYPGDQRNTLSFDASFSDVVKEEFVHTRVLNYLKESESVLNLADIVSSIGEEKQCVLDSLRDLSEDGMVSRIYKDRVPYYSVQFQV